jgi:hypothetical protein
MHTLAFNDSDNKFQQLPLDEFDKFQRKMRMRNNETFKPVVSGRYLKPIWNEKPYSPIKKDDMPLDKYLQSKQR